MNFHRLKRSAFIFLILLFSQYSKADNAARASQLLSYFKSGCSMEGEWTNVAIGQAQALIESLRSIENDESCKSASGIISNLGQLNSYFQTIQQNSNERQIMALQNQQQQLLLELGSTSDPSLIATITAELRTVQTQLAVLEGYQNYDSNFNQLNQTEQAMRDILGTTSTVFKTLEANQGCWSKYPGVLSSAATLGGGIASAFSSSGYAIIVKAAVDLIGQVVDYSRKWNIKYRINKSAHPIASLAFQCGTEKIIDNWCGAEDARKAVELKESVLSQDYSDDNIWIGVRILDRELPRVLDWLKEVRAGAEPTTNADADRQNRVIFREASVRTSKNKVKGILNENRDIFNSAGGRDAKWSVLRRILNEIIATTKNASVLNEIYPFSYAPYYLLGIAINDAPRNSEGGFQDINVYSPPADMNFSLDSVDQLFSDWILLSEDVVQNELNLVLQVDALGVINNAVDNLGIPNRETPRISIQRIKSFLTNNIPTTFQNSTHRIIYQDTIQTLEKIGINIDKVFADNDSIPPGVALVNINKIAKLTFGNIFIQNRILRSIRYSLNDIVIRRRNDGDSLASQLLAADDIINALNKYSPNGAMNLTALRLQIAQAQSMSQKTLSNFTKFFGNKIQKTLKEYDRLAKNSGENEKGPNMMAKAALCLKLISVDKWPKRIPFELCEGVKLLHPNPKGPQIRVTSQMKDLPFNKRACVYRDYLRKSLIFNRSAIPLKKD